MIWHNISIFISWFIVFPFIYLFILKKELGSMYGEYGNPNLQVPLCPF
jgi:hypothetical protein